MTFQEWWESDIAPAEERCKSRYDKAMAAWDAASKELEDYKNYAGYLELQIIKGWAYEMEELASVLRSRYTIKELRRLSDMFQEEE